MELFRKKDSRFWWYDFKLPGVPRQRKSTKETNETRAGKIAALKLAAALEGRVPLVAKKVPLLSQQWDKFKQTRAFTARDADTQRYYSNGWRIVQDSPIAKMRLTEIRKTDVTDLPVPGSASNVNNVRRTVRRLLKIAEEAGIIAKCPRIPLLEEKERIVILDEAAELAILPHSPQPLYDIVILMRDTGLRNQTELYAMRIEQIDWTNRTYRVIESKTEAGERFVPLTDRAIKILKTRCDGRDKGWVFPSRQKGKHITAGLVNKQWVKAREAAGLPEDLVLYSGRHDFGTYLMDATGNLKGVMLVMGHTDYTSALRYQKPKIDPMRDALNKRNKSRKGAVVQFRARSVAQR